MKKSILFVCGFLTPLLLSHLLPPAPPFSERLNRATYWQSYETSYFSSVRGYENLIQEAYKKGLIPIVVFGDSSIRGTGASGTKVWTTQLENRLRKTQSNIIVINYAQNAGDLVGPFLYHHLYKKFPDAYFIVQWNYPAQIAVRHPFHYWLTSEIALRDGNSNPVVKRSYDLYPHELMELSLSGISTEQYSFIFAQLNIVFNYLDLGNWVRYLIFGRVYGNEKRRIVVEPLKNAPESDIDVFDFKIRDPEHTKTMREIFVGIQHARENFLKIPDSIRKKYFDEVFPRSMRNKLLILTIDLNPYYAPDQTKEQLRVRSASWEKIRCEMKEIPDLRWVSLTESKNEMKVNDYMDLGHLTPSGQIKVAEAVANNILGPDGWFTVEKGRVK